MLHHVPPGLQMNDATIRAAVGLRLGCSLCKLHTCHHCGADVDAFVTRGHICRRSEGRHSALNDMIHRVLSAAKMSSRLEPAGVYRSDGKKPDGITMVPWEYGKLLVWDATCADTFAPSHLASAPVRQVKWLPWQRVLRKKAKYANLDPSLLFQTVWRLRFREHLAQTHLPL